MVPQAKSRAKKQPTSGSTRKAAKRTPKKAAQRASTKAPKQAPGKRARNKAQTKARILEAALELFRKQGFHKTTTKQISRKARIAEGTLFNYFKTKEDLALYFFETELQNCIDWYHEEEYIRSVPLPEKLFGLVQHYLDRVEPYEDFIGAVYLRALQPRSKLNPLSLEVQELRLRQLLFIRDILEQAEEEEEIPPLGDFGVYALGLGFLAIVTYWLNDASENKENTMALLDRALTVGSSVLRRGGWEW